MKNRQRIRVDYGQFVRKLFFETILLMVVSFFAVVFLVYLFLGPLRQVTADLVQFFLFFLEDSILYGLYFFVVNNLVLVIIAGIVLLFLVLFYFQMRRVTRYFDQINSGIDALIADEDRIINFSPEMTFMERKLSTLKQTLREREQAAAEAEQRKNDLVVYLAHDIKTPLTSVIGYLSLLEEASDMPEAQRAKYLKITLDKAYRLERLINEFFEITRFNSQRIILDKDKIDLQYMLMQLTDEFYPILTAQEKSTEIDCAEELQLYGDRDQLARVFNNILKNAVAYSEPGSVVKISATEGEHDVTISFSNQGHTIPADKLSAIFEKFYRLDEARGSETGGAGLGLAIAKEIVTQHGGTIEAESKQGLTVFRVTLPRPESVETASEPVS